MAVGLHETLIQLEAINCLSDGALKLPNDHVSPGCTVTVCALAHSLGYAIDHIHFAFPKQHEYLTAVGIEAALGSNDTYAFARHNSGSNYSPIARLDGENATDEANSLINSCLRSIAPEAAGTRGFDMFCHVIGEMHSNVWDHGKGTGFSGAQRSKVPYEDDFFFEFALADTGMGFKSEMTRVGNNPSSDVEAIKWCMVEGNTTKSSRERDEFAQRLPEDHSGNSPYGGSVDQFKADDQENHHQGLGLYHLKKLILEVEGDLWLASGTALLAITNGGEDSYTNLPLAWKGVALACRIRQSKLIELSDSQRSNPEIDRIINMFRRT